MSKHLGHIAIALTVAIASIPLAIAQTPTEPQAPSGQTMATPLTNGSVNPANTVPGPAMTGGPNLRLSATDSKFLDDDSHGSAYERELAEIAARKATNPQVKQYAQMIVRDHNEYNAALQSVGQDAGVTLSSAPDRDQVQKLHTFETMSGPQFDSAFLKEMVQINQQDAQEAQQEADTTMNPQIRDFILQFKPMDEKHLQDAQKLQS